jgi:hypothetical protein
LISSFGKILRGLPEELYCYDLNLREKVCLGNVTCAKKKKYQMNYLTMALLILILLKWCDKMVREKFKMWQRKKS